MRQRLALFDLDDTLIDLRAAFRSWAAEFTADHRLANEAVNWLVALDRAGLAYRGEIFVRVYQRFALRVEADALWSDYRRRMPRLVTCAPELVDGWACSGAEGIRKPD